MKFWLWFEYFKCFKVVKFFVVFFVIFIVIFIYVLCVEIYFRGFIDLFKYKEEFFILMCILEKVCIFWFILEFILWLILCLNKLWFIFDILNLIDLVVILLYYYFEFFLSEFKNDKNIDVIRFLRVFRLLKLIWYLEEFRVFVKIVCFIWWEFVMILFFIFIIIVIFFGWIFYVEYEE